MRGRPGLTGERLGEVVGVFERAAGVGHGYEGKDENKSEPEKSNDTPSPAKG